MELKLASLRYELPRVSLERDGFDRQSAKGMTRGGKGESQLEIDKRNILSEINKLEKKLKSYQENKNKQIKRHKENNIMNVALVGYTNAGKSTTMNSIINYTNSSKKEVEAKDELFKTLSTSVRKINYNGVNFLLTDTIGFVSKLPHQLIHSFLDTLEEVKSADLIIHVIDSSSKYAVYQFETTMAVLNHLKVLDKDMLVLLNKSDLGRQEISVRNIDYLNYSNFDMQSIKSLLDYISKFITSRYLEMELFVRYDDKMIGKILENSKVLSQIYEEDGIYIKALVKNTYVKEFSLYEIKDEYVS